MWADPDPAGQGAAGGCRDGARAPNALVAEVSDVIEGARTRCRGRETAHLRAGPHYGDGPPRPRGGGGSPPQGAALTSALPPGASRRQGPTRWARPLAPERWSGSRPRHAAFARTIEDEPGPSSAVRPRGLGGAGALALETSSTAAAAPRATPRRLRRAALAVLGRPGLSPQKSVVRPALGHPGVPIRLRRNDGRVNPSL